MQYSQSQQALGQSSVPISQPSLDQQQKQLYAQQLRMQMDEQKQRQLQEKQNDRLQDVKMLLQVNQSTNRGGGGAPLRDGYGNVTTTRRNPYNPNSQSVQWLGAPVLQEQQQINQLTQSRYQQPMQQSMINLNPLPQYQETLTQSMVNAPANDLAEMEKRQRQLLLQGELLQQINDRERKKQEEKMRERRDKELDDLRVIRERELIERKMREDFSIDKLGKRNLQETNFDVDGLKALKRLEMLKYQNELIEQQNRRNAKTNPLQRQRTPVYEAEKSYRDRIDDSQRERIEQRIIKELPIEVERTVKETVNVELQRLRQEMQLSTNQVSEQMVQLKGQLLKSNEQRHYNEEQIRNLKEELRTTQIVDEIRQRELYQAFLNQEKSRQIIDTTQRLMTPDSVKFTFPRRPRPYYNLSDPYLGSNDDANRDLHQIISDNSSMIPLNYDHGKDLKFDMDKIEDKMLYNRKEIQEDSRKGYQVDQNFDLPEDYLNRQKLYVPKKFQEENSRNNYDYDNLDKYPISLASQDNNNYYNNNKYNNDSMNIIGNTNPQYVVEDNEIKDVIQRYQNKIEKLDEINLTSKQQNIDSMDYALQDLLEQQKNKINRIDQYKEHYEYNDYYSPDYQETTFNTKMGQILNNNY